MVHTPSGALRGRWRDDVARFAGVPYAQPPVGDGRFRPPRPLEPWEGERDAARFGPISPQNPSLMDALFGGESEQWDEDCLFLNVWTPRPEPDAGLPVMVWIHGGGFEMGSGSSPLYHGESFAREGVVLVTINYRLGPLGFLELGHLDPSLAGSGNLGLLDQIAALRWVREKIASFGGDPGNVTVFGESAGAMSISLLLTMPSARGLFDRAIVQSGAADSARTPDRAEADCKEFMAACGLGSVEEVLEAPIETLLAGHATMAAARVADPEAVIRTHGNPLSFLSFRPVADGREVPSDPLGAVAAGAAKDVPLIVGTNLEEWRLFALLTQPTDSEESLLRRMALLVDDADGALAAYRTEHPEASIAELEGAFLTDVVFRIPGSHLAEAQSRHATVHQYRWDWRSPAWGGAIGAAHAVEIPFVFDLVEDQRLHVFVGPEAPKELSRAIHETWISFARTGRPEVPGGPEWPALRPGGPRPVLVWDSERRVIEDPEPVTTAFWRAHHTILDD